MSKPLREVMPETAAFIDALRDAFGKEHIDAQIKLGMQGAQTFFAEEGGQEVGTRFDVPKNAISSDKMAFSNAITLENLKLKGKKQ